MKSLPLPSKIPLNFGHAVTFTLALLRPFQQSHFKGCTLSLERISFCEFSNCTVQTKYAVVH